MVRSDVLRRHAGIAAEVLQKLWNAGYARGKGPLRSAVRRRYARERTVDWVSAACLLTRRDTLETVSGFDENFFLYSEDIDLCARIRATGARILFTPEVEIVHLLGRSVAKNRDRVVYESHRSRLYFYQKASRTSKFCSSSSTWRRKRNSSEFFGRDRALCSRILELAHRVALSDVDLEGTCTSSRGGAQAGSAFDSGALESRIRLSRIPRSDNADSSASGKDSMPEQISTPRTVRRMVPRQSATVAVYGENSRWATASWLTFPRPAPAS
jgi:hypothetical protein